MDVSTERNIRDCNVAVIGGAGFLGSHLVNHLINERRCRAIVVDNLVAGHRKFVHPQAIFVHADITQSEQFLERLFRKHGVQYVFNYAAWPYIPDSFKRPLHVFETNATGAIQVINAAHEAGCKAVLQVSSAEIYGDNGHGDTYHEDTKLSELNVVRPHSTYGVAKAAVDYYCQSAWAEQRTPVIALRQFNCIGERETHPYVVPEIMSQLAQQVKTMSVPIVRLGNNSRRDFQYAGDAVAMAVALLEKGAFGEVYNMGSEQSISIYELARLIGKVVGFADIEIQTEQSRKRPWEIWHLRSDNSKLFRTIYTRPTTTLEQALQRTWEDYSANGLRWVWEN